MINKERFEITVSVWINAFLKGTLAKGDCAACAVGNLAAHGLGEEVEIVGSKVIHEGLAKDWGFLFHTNINEPQLFFKKHLEDPNVKKSIYATGYHYKDLMKIEKAFEKNTKIDVLKYNLHTEKEILEDQFNGLMACFEVLEEIHQIKDGSFKEDFEKQLMVRL